MKSKRKNIIKAGLLGAALMLGTGYAVINNSVLTATGTVPIAEKNLDVRIVNCDAENAQISPDGLTVTFAVTSWTWGPDSGDIILMADTTFENRETDLTVDIDFDYEITTPEGNELNLDFYVEVFFGNDGETPQDNQQIAPGNQGTIKTYLYTYDKDTHEEYRHLRDGFPCKVVILAYLLACCEPRQ
jgi:hypothetical protein